MSSKDVLERKRIESLVKEGFLPIRAQFLRGPSSPEEENVDGPKKPLKGGKGEGKATVLQSNKNGLRQGTKSQKQRKREKYLSMRNDLCHFCGGWEGVQVSIDRVVRTRARRGEVFRGEKRRVRRAMLCRRRRRRGRREVSVREEDERCEMSVWSSVLFFRST